MKTSLLTVLTFVAMIGVSGSVYANNCGNGTDADNHAKKSESAPAPTDPTDLIKDKES